MIPSFDLKLQYAALKTELDAAIAQVLASGHFINGPNVAALETAVADYVGSTYGVALNSGTDALYLALRALDVGPGDEVITTPFSFIATSEAIEMVGAAPVFADIDPLTYTLDCAAAAAAVSPRTKAILPVHLFGGAADMSNIMALASRHSLAVIEDCAQAIGADVGGRRVGTLGEIGCFSFFPTKNLGAYGDGGLVTTDDRQLAERVRRLRAHGGRIKYHHEEHGVNSRLDELQAAILRVKLGHLERWTHLRRGIAAAYDERLMAMPGVTTPACDVYGRHVYHQYTIAVEGRDGVQRRMRAAGVETAVYYPLPLHLQPVHAPLGYTRGDFPNAERAAALVLSLPMYPELPASYLQRTADALRAATDYEVPLQGANR
jgi:dTDP-4-amino-4,6-dideoxygalactose transaminase